MQIPDNSALSCDIAGYICIGTERKIMVQDMSNQRYGRLRVLSFFGRNGSRQLLWNCLCDCGKRTITSGSSLRLGRANSCGCYHNQKMSQRLLKDITGKRFGRLTVIRRSENNKNYVEWDCICDCGSVAKVRSACLNTGRTQSCGCLHRDTVSIAPYLHLFNGLKRTAKKKNISCELTYEDFLEFVKITTCHYCLKPIQWQKHSVRGSKRYHLDRTNNALGYCKSNVVVCCPECNHMKSGFSYDMFYDFTRPIRESKGEK